MTNSNECREAFEKFLLTEFGYPAGALSKYGDGKYFNIPAQNYWEAFQAGWKRIRRTEMSNDVIDMANEIEKLQIKAAMELSNSWIIERLLLVNSIALYLLEKGDKEEAMAWMEGLLDWAEEDLLSEAKNNASDLGGWFNNRMENEVGTTKALEIIRSETPSAEKIKKSLEESGKKLAEYENMEPVAWQFECLDKESGHWWRNISDYKSDVDSIKYSVRNIIPLYRHPNK